MSAPGARCGARGNGEHVWARWAGFRVAQFTSTLARFWLVRLRQTHPASTYMCTTPPVHGLPGNRTELFLVLRSRFAVYNSFSQRFQLFGAAGSSTHTLRQLVDSLAQGFDQSLPAGTFRAQVAAVVTVVPGTQAHSDSPLLGHAQLGWSPCFGTSLVTEQEKMVAELRANVFPRLRLPAFVGL